jgi:hypothetical protein
VSEIKPKIFEDIYNNISDVRCDVKVLQGELMEKVDIIKMHQERM